MGTAIAASAAAVALLVVASGSAGTVLATPISSDPYTNPDSQHATQVEPDSFAFGNTIVVAIQTGRYVNGGGASNIAWATSTDAGRHWVTGVASGHDGLRGRARGRGSAIRPSPTTPSTTSG